MSRSKSIATLLESAEPELRKYFDALESENTRLHKKIAKLEVQDMSKNHRITALENELKEEIKRHAFNLKISFTGEKPANSV